MLTSFHEFYHVGQYYQNALNLFRLVAEQVVDTLGGGLGAKEKEAYAASFAFRAWADKNKKSCTQ